MQRMVRNNAASKQILILRYSVVYTMLDLALVKKQSVLTPKLDVIGNLRSTFSLQNPQELVVHELPHDPESGMQCHSKAFTSPVSLSCCMAPSATRCFYPYRTAVSTRRPL